MTMLPQETYNAAILSNTRSLLVHHFLIERVGLKFKALTSADKLSVVYEDTYSRMMYIFCADGSMLYKSTILSLRGRINRKEKNVVKNIVETYYKSIKIILKYRDEYSRDPDIINDTRNLKMVFEKRANWRPGENMFHCIITCLNKAAFFADGDTPTWNSLRGAEADYLKSFTATPVDVELKKEHKERIGRIRQKVSNENQGVLISDEELARAVEQAEKISNNSQDITPTKLNISSVKIDATVEEITKQREYRGEVFINGERMKSYFKEGWTKEDLMNEIAKDLTNINIKIIEI